MPELIVKLGDQVLQTRKIDGDVVRIGRSRENDIVLENLSVSREHATVRLHDGKFVLTDLNSANGTLVNGVKITKTEIVDEDVITIGKHKLHFRNRVLDDIGSGDGDGDACHTVMMEPKADAWLTVESGRLKGRDFKITRFETSLGKAATNDVVLTDDWLLGKKQAIILRKGNHAFEIQDLGGLRKVKVNGTAISEKAPIADNDLIEMGGTKLIFHTSVGAGQPTGRVPSELPVDSNRVAGNMGAAMVRPGGQLGAEDSLDLEDGFKSLKVTMQEAAELPEGVPAAEAAEQAAGTEEHEAEAREDVAVVDGQEPPAAADEVTPAQPVAAAIPEPAEAAAAADAEVRVAPVVSAQAAAPAKVIAESARNHMFEDQRSTTRRRRKHQQRAAARHEGASTNGSTASAAAVEAAYEARPVANPTELSNEAEIRIWEEALKNNSPAIKRQAVRMLKKLTGNDYDA